MSEYNMSHTGAELDEAINKVKSGTGGKSAYEYAQEGGYTGTEAEFAAKLAEKPLIGTTEEITPNQVLEAMLEGRPIGITHTDSLYGFMAFNSFAMSVAAGNSIISCVNFEMGNAAFCAQLIGNLISSKWIFQATELAKKSDIPTDVHINELIDTKLGVIENGSY